MTQEEKQLLLKDLSGRLPYGVRYKGDGGWPINPYQHTTSLCNILNAEEPLVYLRPMSSMTEEEENEWSGFNIDPLLEAIGKPHTRIEDLMLRAKSQYNPLDWLNEHHFDYRGLIPMGLALEAPADMYKTE